MPTQLVINSRERISGTSSNFFIDIKKEKMEGNNYVSCSKASIPKSYHIIAEGQNVFYLQEDGYPPLQVLVEKGNYSRKELTRYLAALLTNLSPSGAVYSIEIPKAPDTGYLNFSVDPPIETTFIFTQSKMYERLGFERNKAYPFTEGKLTSPNVINLVRETTLFVKTNLCGNDDDDTLAVILTSGSSDFSYIEYQNNETVINSKKLVSNTAASAQFWITDEDSNPIDLNGCEYVLVLCLFNIESVD